MIKLSYDGIFFRTWGWERIETFYGHAPGPDGFIHIFGPPFHEVTPTKIFIGIIVTNCHVNKKCFK